VPTPAPAFQPRVHEAPASAVINQNHSSASISEEADEEEVASIKRVPAVTLQLWKTLLRPRGFESNAGKLVRSPIKSQAGTGERDVEMSPLSAKTKTGRKGKEREREGDVNAAGSVLSSSRRANSFAPPRSGSHPPQDNVAGRSFETDGGSEDIFESVILRS
jgi:DNA replication regulator DPB11